VRVADLKSLQLPVAIHESVEQIIQDNRMYWEPWLESADSYEDLKTSLHRRGYRDLYVSSKPLYDGTNLFSPPEASLTGHPQRKTMVKKKG